MGILILGAGGHGKVVADILQLQGLEVIGFLDDNPTTWNMLVLGLPVLGTINRYKEFDPDGLVLGIGSNAIRQRIVERLGTQAANLWINAIHPAAVIARSVQLGHGIVLAAHTVINPDTCIGDQVIVNTGATVDHDCMVGSYAHIAPGVHLAGSTKIGEGVVMGVASKTIPNRSIGDWSIVGAGATVIRDIPEHVIAKGTPARW